MELLYIDNMYKITQTTLINAYDQIDVRLIIRQLSINAGDIFYLDMFETMRVRVYLGICNTQLILIPQNLHCFFKR